MRFLMHCGECPKWADEHCSKYDQARHSRRELCLPEWEKEVKRLAKLVRAKDSQVKIALVEGPILDPMRTMQSLGYTKTLEELSYKGAKSKTKKTTK